MSESVVSAMPGALAALLGPGIEVGAIRRLGGGASKEAWAVDALLDGSTRRLLVRRMGGGVLHEHTVSLCVEHAVIAAVAAAGAQVPRPLGYIADLAGRDAFVMERLDAEGIGRRIVQRDDFSAARAVLPRQMAAALAAIHGVPADRLGMLPRMATATPAAWRVIRQLERKLDESGEPHPAIELGLLWLRDRVGRSGADREQPTVLVHGDFRIGNLLVDAHGLAAVIDWEFAHRGHPLEDLAWPLVRAWRFGRDTLRLGGIAPVDDYLEHYNRLAGTRFTVEQLDWWEVAGNVRWAISCLTQARRHLSGEERNVEYAVLGRLAGEVEHEILQLIGDDCHAGSA